MTSAEIKVSARRGGRLLAPRAEIESYDYVRETPVTCNSPYHTFVARKSPVFCDQHKILGYVVVRKDRGASECLVWWLKTYDRDVGSERVYEDHSPSEAVHPSRMLSFFDVREV